MTEPYRRELTTQERAAVRKLVSRCANYDAQGQLCLCTGGACYMRKKVWTGALCRYFRSALLPTNPALESVLSKAGMPQARKRCAFCGKAYIPVTSQAYCSDLCRLSARRRAERERKRRERRNRD